MIWLLKKLIFGHVHKWETIQTANVFANGAPAGSRPEGWTYVQKCETCGIVVRRDLT